MNDINTYTVNDNTIGPVGLTSHDIIGNNNDNDMYDNNIIDQIAEATTKSYDGHGYHVSSDIDTVTNNQMIIRNHNNYIKTNDNTNCDATLLLTFKTKNNDPEIMIV